MGLSPVGDELGVQAGVLATADPHVLDLVAARGGSFVALPGSDGRVHGPDVLYPGVPLA